MQAVFGVPPTNVVGGSTPSFKLLSPWVVVTLSALVFASGCSYRGTYLAALKINSGNVGKVASTVKLSELSAGEEIELVFRLPTQISPTSEMEIVKGDGEISLAKPFVGGRGQQFFERVVGKADANGDFELEYVISVGAPASDIHSGTYGPRYGFANNQTFASSLDHLLPVALVGGQRVSSYSVSIESDGYELYRTRPQFELEVLADGTIGALVLAGRFEETTISRDGIEVVVASAESLNADQRNEISLMLEDLRYLKSDKSPDQITIISLPEYQGSVAALRGRTTVAIDLLPLTRERSYRTVRAVVEAVTLPKFYSARRDKATAPWLANALPGYFGARALERMGYADAELVAYNKQEDLMARIGTGARLAELDEVPTQRRTSIATTSGYLTLKVIESTLSSSGVTVESVLKDLFSRGDEDFSFRDRVVAEIGASKASAVWEHYVDRQAFDHQIVSPDKLRPLDSVEKPQSTDVSILVSGGLFGNLELCGCKLNQYGGAARRATLLRRAAKGATILDVGAFLPRTQVWPRDEITQLEGEAQIELMGQLPYHAVALTETEFPFLEQIETARGPFVSGNLPGVASWRSVPVGDDEFAVVAWTDFSRALLYRNHSWLAGAENKVTYSQDALERILVEIPPNLSGVILVGNLNPVTVARVLGRHHHRVKAVVSTYDGNAVSPFSFGHIGSVPVVYWPGDEGATVIELLLDKTPSGLHLIDVVEHEMSSEVEDDPSVLSYLDTVYNSDRYLKAANSSGASEKGPTAGLFSELRDAGSQHVGSESCQTCHAAEYKQWSSTAHAFAIKSLIDKRRNRSPGCVRCHVVGFGETGGYDLQQASRTLENVGCEVCHGPGSLHLAQPSSNNIRRNVPESTCRTCHTADHSDFGSNPTQYLVQVIHESNREKATK